MNLYEKYPAVLQLLMRSGRGFRSKLLLRQAVEREGLLDSLTLSKTKLLAPAI